MDSDLSYISRTSLPQFSGFDYEKEDPVIPAIDSDYDPAKINRVLSEEGAVLLQDASKGEVLDAISIRVVDKITSLSEVGRALNPTETRGVTELYEAENEDSIYLTENQYRTRFL